MNARMSTAREIDWNALYADQLPRVYNYFRYRIGDDALSEDLTAATFEKAWRGRQQYRRDRAAFSTWLFTIARNVAVDHFRRYRLSVPLEAVELQADSPAPDEIVEYEDDVARLSGLLAQLASRERELVALKYGAGLNNREIARLTGLGESNVGTILYRVVRKLRAQWEDG
jgi:RNA polymerase sigma factor (sigma-70 family)